MVNALIESRVITQGVCDRSIVSSANCLDPDQAPKNVGPDLYQISLTYT